MLRRLVILSLVLGMTTILGFSLAGAVRGGPARAAPPVPPALRDIVQQMLDDFNTAVVQPIADSVAQLSTDVDNLEQDVQDLEQRVQDLEQDGGGPSPGAGSVTGRLVDQQFFGTFLLECVITIPVEDEIVALEGTSLSDLTGADGSFLIEGVPVGRFLALTRGEAPGAAILLNNVRVPTDGETVDLGNVPGPIAFGPAPVVPECSPDVDGDGVANLDDNCPTITNADQSDSDGDGLGDACDGDRDGDGFDDFTEQQSGSDPDDGGSTPEAGIVAGSCSDGVDNDADGLIDGDDPSCDQDGDGVLDDVDNCPPFFFGEGVRNPDQADSDGDGQGDACDFDDDNDGFSDFDEQTAGSDPLDAASTPESGLIYGAQGSCSDGVDNDLDTLIDGNDPSCDRDRDGVLDEVDNCPFQRNPGQVDSDSDGEGDACDSDDDNDGFSDFVEEDLGSNPKDPDSTPESGPPPGWSYPPPVFGTCSDGVDNDLDGLVDGADPSCDRDSDGVIDEIDNCAPYGFEDPAYSWNFNPDQWDFDGDGQGNKCDSDDDADGFDDFQELELGSFPLNPDSTPESRSIAGTCSDGVDNDLDALVDGDDPGCEPVAPFDGDGDGVPDDIDNCKFTPNAGQENADGDALGDACDPDNDNDGFDDFFEEATGSDPLDPGSTPETIFVGGTCDDGIDNDGDGLIDGDDPLCAIPSPISYPVSPALSPFAISGITGAVTLAGMGVGILGIAFASVLGLSKLMAVEERRRS